MPLKMLSQRTQDASSVEVKLEFYMSAKSLKVHTRNKKAFKAEYAIVNSQDAPGNREPFGVVVIEPTTHSPSYSVSDFSTEFGNCSRQSCHPSNEL